MDAINHPITILAERYPQLKFPISDLTKLTPEYKAVVFSGEKCNKIPQFSYSPFDTLEVETTPAGSVDVIYFYMREDFEHAIRALAHRCENVPISKTMGASTIFGLPNWDTINKHMDAYDGLHKDEEFQRFVSDKTNYTDTVIVISSGEYAGVSADMIGLDNSSWLEASKTIRKYHELAHYTSNRLFPENKDTVRDEIVADMIGIVAALKKYDQDIAKAFIGTEGKTYRDGGRLELYSRDLKKDIIRSDRIIESLFREYNRVKSNNPYEVLKYVESNRVGIFE